MRTPALPLALDEEAREQIRVELASLPIEYQTRALEGLRRIVQTFARMTGQPIVLPPNVIPIHR